MENDQTVVSKLIKIAFALVDKMTFRGPIKLKLFCKE